MIIMILIKKNKKKNSDNKFYEGFTINHTVTCNNVQFNYIVAFHSLFVFNVNIKSLEHHIVHWDCCKGELILKIQTKNIYNSCQFFVHASYT